MPTTTTRQVATGLAILYASAVAFIVFWPSADHASDSVDWMTEALYGMGAPHWITGQMVEFLANIALFVPLSLLGSVLLDRWRLEVLARRWLRLVVAQSS